MFVRDNNVLSLEEAHWRCRRLPAHCAGFDDRGTLEEGAPADIDRLQPRRARVLTRRGRPRLPRRRVAPHPAGEGLPAILVNGEPTFIDGKETGALPGLLLRHGGAAVTKAEPALLGAAT